MSNTIRQLRLAGFALAATLAAACALAASDAHAVNLLTCPAGNSTNTWSPALTNTPTPVATSYSVNLGTCVGVSPLTRTGGSSGSSSPTPRSCTDLLVSRTGITTTISWSTGTTSTITADTNATYLTGGILETTLIGTVTSGEFTGGHVVYVLEEVGADPLTCGTTGVTSSSGPLTLAITP